MNENFIIFFAVILWLLICFYFVIENIFKFNIFKYFNIAIIEFFEKMRDNILILSITIFIVILIAFCLLTYFIGFDKKGFSEGIQVELFGLLLDVLLVVVFFNWINSKGERNRRINDFHNEIDDFRYWKSKEAKQKIISCIKGLNRFKVSKMFLNHCDLSGNNDLVELTNLTHVSLCKSSLTKSSFKYCNLSNADFSQTVCKSTQFCNSNLEFSKFSDAILKGVNFEDCNLVDSKFVGARIENYTNFENSDLRGIDFTKAYFDTARFNNSKVSINFIDQLEIWNIKGIKIFNNYLLVSDPTKIRIDENYFLLISKTTFNNKSRLYYKDLEEIIY